MRAPREIVSRLFVILAVFGTFPGMLRGEESPEGVRFFEQKIRPLLAEHCYECHSEQAGE